MARRTMDLTTLANSVASFNPQADRLQQIVQRKLTDERLGNVVDKLLDKAEGGDTKALDYLLSIGGYKPAEPSTIVVNQFIENEQPRQIQINSATGQLNEVQMVTTFLSVAGPVTPDAIADGTKLDRETVVKVLDAHPNRFGADGKTYFLIGAKKTQA